MARRDDWTSVVAVSVAVAVTMLDTFGISQSLPTIGSDLGATDTQLQWILNATILATALALIPAGRAADRWGRRRLAVLGLVVFAVGSIASALAPSIETLIVLRTIAGLGTAAVVAASLAIVTTSVCHDSEAKAIATWTAITAAGGAIGPIVAGTFTQELSWRWFLGGVGALSILLAGYVRTTVSESKDPSSPSSLDIGGIATLALGLGATVYGLMIIPDHGLASPPVVIGLAAGAAGIVAFVVVERRADEPMLDLDLFARRQYLGVAAVALIANWAYAVMIFYVPQYLQNVLDLGATAAGAVFLTFTVPYALLSLAVGRAITTIGPFPLMTTGLSVLVVAFVLAGAISVTQGLAIVVTSLLIAAVGQSLVFNSSGTLAMELGGSSRGMASGVLSTVRQLGFLMGLAVTGTIVQVTQSRRLDSALAAAGIDATASERGEILAGISGSTIESGPIMSRLGDQAVLDGLSNQLFVDGLRLGYWTVAGMCALGIVASIVARPRRGDRASDPLTNQQGKARRA